MSKLFRSVVSSLRKQEGEGSAKDAPRERPAAPKGAKPSQRPTAPRKALTPKR